MSSVIHLLQHAAHMERGTIQVLESSTVPPQALAELELEPDSTYMELIPNLKLFHASIHVPIKLLVWKQWSNDVKGLGDGIMPFCYLQQLICHFPKQEGEAQRRTAVFLFFK